MVPYEVQCPEGFGGFPHDAAGKIFVRQVAG